MNGGLAEYTPLKQLEITLSKERYDAVEKAFAHGLEAEHKNSPKSVSFAEFLPDEGYSKMEEQQGEDLDQDDESWDW